MKPGLSASDLTKLAQAIDVLRRASEEVEVVPEIREYTAREVAKYLHRSNSWVSAHAAELGGYRLSPNGNWHFPGFAIKRYQERQSAAQARSELREAG